jgi:hypothetical protein
MTMLFDKPTILHPPDPPPRCCAQQSITVPPDVAAKTRQRFNYLTLEWQEHYAQRTAAERAFASIKDPAGENMNRGSIRLLGRTKIRFLRTFAWIARNLRILEAHQRRLPAQETTPPRRTRRKRRHRTYRDLLPEAALATPPATGPPPPD